MPKKRKENTKSIKTHYPKRTGRDGGSITAEELIKKLFGKLKTDYQKYPFIHPEIIQISKEFISKYTDQEKKQIPESLHPFLQNLDLSILADALRRKSLLYFDPIVSAQISYLSCLRKSELLWDQFGWQVDLDDDTGNTLPPDEVGQAEEFLKMLLEAHVKVLFPYRKLELKLLPRPRGPKAGLKNPHPTSDPWTQFIDAQTIYSEYKFLKELIDKSIQIPSVVKPSKQTIERINLQAMKVLEESQIHWSGLHQLISDSPAFDPNKPKPTDPKQRRARLFRWIMQSKEKWEPLELEDAIVKMCSGKMGNAGKDGKPSYLAYAILGSLLKVSPETIWQKIDNYRHKRHSRKKRTS